MNDLHEEAVRLQNIADQAIEGGDALGAYVYLHQLEKIVGEAKKQIQDAAIEERERYGRKEEITRHGFVVTIMETSRYSFSDPEIDRLKALVKSREDLAKKALQLAEGGHPFFDQNGEVIPPAERKFITTIKTELKR